MTFSLNYLVILACFRPFSDRLEMHVLRVRFQNSQNYHIYRGPGKSKIPNVFIPSHTPGSQKLVLWMGILTQNSQTWCRKCHFLEHTLKIGKKT